jgi:hypothetical protein
VVYYNNELYVADTGNNRVSVWDLNGNPQRQWGSWGAHYPYFHTLIGIHEYNEEIYTSDAYGVEIYNPDGTYVGNFLSTGYSYYNNSCIYKDVMYRTKGAWGGSGVFMYNMATKAYIGSFGLPQGSGDANTNNPNGICGYEDEIYVADEYNSAIKVFSTTGTFIRKRAYPVTTTSWRPKKLEVSSVSDNVGELMFKPYTAYAHFLDSQDLDAAYYQSLSLQIGDLGGCCYFYKNGGRVECALCLIGVAPAPPTTNQMVILRLDQARLTYTMSGGGVMGHTAIGGGDANLPRGVSYVVGTNGGMIVGGGFPRAYKEVNIPSGGMIAGNDTAHGVDNFTVLTGGVAGGAADYQLGAWKKGKIWYSIRHAAPATPYKKYTEKTDQSQTWVDKPSAIN